MDVCEDGHTVVSDGWMAICVLTNDTGFSWSYSPDGSGRDSALLRLDVQDPAMDRTGRVRREGRTGDSTKIILSDTVIPAKPA